MIYTRRSLILNRLILGETGLSLDDLEKKGIDLLNRGYRVMKSIHVNFWNNNFEVVFSSKPSKNTNYLKMKAAYERAERLMKEAAKA